MGRSTPGGKSHYVAVAVLCFLTVRHPAALGAQDRESADELHKTLSALIKEQNYVGALPVLEKLMVTEPDDPRNNFLLGFALIAKANTLKDAEARKGLRIRARQSFIKAKDLGSTESVLDALIQSIPPDGAQRGTFSAHDEANRIMKEAEAFFASGKLDDALQKYQKALELDPTLYEAALFSGDVYFHENNFPLAEVWYQKAIGIDPNRETAYRYSASPLMKQGKYSEARDRYVEAYISEPYNRFSSAGLAQWAQAANAKLGHPNIEIPTNISFDEKGNARINLDSKALLDTTDGSSAWLSYGVTRSLWHKEKFAKQHPSESAYRHSLAEEVDALRSVLSLVKANNKAKVLNPSLVKLRKLDNEGLLEAYILMARPDDGIAKDYPEYRKQNRVKLRRYVLQYVLTGGGAETTATPADENSG